MHRSLICLTRRRWFKCFLHRKLCLIFSLIYSLCAESSFCPWLRQAMCFFKLLTHACELRLRLMWSVSDVTCVLLFLQKRQDIYNRHCWTHPITSVSIFIVYGLASRDLLYAVIIERYETPTTRDSLLTSAILFTQQSRGGCVHIHALWTHTARFKVVHLS